MLVMNFEGYVFRFLTNNWLLLGLEIIALAAMFLPHRVIALKTKFPGVFWFILALAVCIQFPLLFGGCWGLGMKYAENRPMSKVVDVSFVLLPFIYLGVFVASLVIQGRRKNADISFAIAAFSSLVLSPFTCFLTIALIGTILKA
jgi:hypothetical protein